jgi:preprotein translocase subunit SecB
MNWHIAPLEVLDYHVRAMSFEVNLKCDKNKPSQLDLEDVEINNELVQMKNDKDGYAVILNIDIKAPENKNTPYAIKLEMYGYFKVPQKMPEESRDKIVKTNGTSILYGAAREIIREMTARGGYRPILIPTESFAELPKKDISITSSKLSDIKK